MSVRSLLLLAASLIIAPASAATIEEIGPENRFPMQGKETDWIDGDYVISNDQIIAVIAKPSPLRNANMTVRGVGACIIDLTRRDVQSDQLSCFYPAAGRFQFHDVSLVEQGELDGGGIFWRCGSSGSLLGTQAKASVEYQLRDGDPFITVIVRVSGVDTSKVKASDGVRADRTFKFETLKDPAAAYCEDEFFRQTYGFQPLDPAATVEWANERRLKVVRYQGGEAASEDKLNWTTRLYPASSPLDLWGMTRQGAPQTFVVDGAVGVQPRIKLSVIEGAAGSLNLPASWRSAADGRSVVHLPAGSYRIRAEAIGHESVEATIDVGSEAGQHQLTLGPAARVRVSVTDQSGGEIPCKVTFYGNESAGDEPTTDPQFGLDSQSGSVGNCVYSANGSFVRSIPPGSYDVLISRGPEYDVIDHKISVTAGQEVAIGGVLKRVVDTTGWVSAEMHSHSSPSGDNTSDQLGRVENLICEHLEFAPCTEHQRIESYDDQLEILGAERFMATCSGMELTGSPLPINHQNAFPLEWSPFAQDGGGPRTDSNPVKQIARLAMWDDNADKVVQSNHPNMRQMIHDKNLDGKPDGGFASMLAYMDVIEVHPPQDIFLTDEETAAKKNPDSNRMRPWMDLLASGQRIPGVVNTDAHYNFHGSGWLRNWIRCSTDEPTEISTDEMIGRLERGEVVMSTGPFLSVTLHHPELEQPAEIGDTAEIGGGEAELSIKVQCANWLDVNRVEVFVNGKLQPDLSRTRADHPDAFGDGVVKFDQRLKLALPDEAFIIVATIGERMELGRVMGKSFGKQPPVAVSNPIYVK